MSLFFVGNSGAARECYWVWHQAKAQDPAVPTFKGFFSWRGYKDNLCDLEKYSLGEMLDHTPREGELYVIAVGKPQLRLEIYNWLKEKGVAFYTLRHPDVYICPTARIGEANIFASHCCILDNTTIGDANYFNGAITVGHDSIIGNANMCNQNTTFSGAVRVGDCNHFAPYTLVLEHSRIGHHNTFAPASVVYRGCGDYCHMAGNPALIEHRLSS